MNKLVRRGGVIDPRPTYKPFDGEKSRTVQSQREDADINVIVRRFGVTGQLPNNVPVPQYGDFVDAMDFRESMDAIRAAQMSFMSLSAEVRKRFHNDPHEFVEFCSASKDGKLVNLEEMRRMGLAVTPVEPVVPDPIAVRVVADPPAGGS